MKIDYLAKWSKLTTRNSDVKCREQRHRLNYTYDRQRELNSYSHFEHNYHHKTKVSLWEKISKLNSAMVILLESSNLAYAASRINDRKRPAQIGVIRFGELQWLVISLYRKWIFIFLLVGFWEFTCFLPALFANILHEQTRIKG